MGGTFRNTSDFDHYHGFHAVLEEYMFALLFLSFFSNYRSFHTSLGRTDKNFPKFPQNFNVVFTDICIVHIDFTSRGTQRQKAPEWGYWALTYSNICIVVEHPISGEEPK